MAANRIAGLTVEIDGNVTKLNKALSGTNTEIRNAQTALKDVERLLKLDPTNTELLQQRQRLLATSIGETKTKLDQLKDAEKQVQEQVKSGDASQAQYDALRREVIDTEESLKNLEKQAARSNTVLSQISAVSKKISTGSGKVAKAMAPATAAIGALGVMAFNSASDVAESENKVSVAFGDSSKAVEDFAESSLESFGIARGTALDMSALFGDMATSMGLPQSEAATMATSMTGLAGDLASFKNIGIDQAMTALNGVFTGETESLKTLGVVMTQANLEAFALSQGIETNIADMSQAEQVNLRYAYVMSQTKNAQGDFANTSDGAANSIRIMQESAKELSAEFGEALLPVITPIIQKITDLVQWFTNLDDKTKGTILTVIGIIAAISPIAGIISAVTGAISGISAILPVATAATTAQATATAAAGAATTVALGPILIIIGVIAALIAVIVLLVKNWDKVKEVAAAVWEKIKEIWGVVADWFNQHIIQPVKNIFNGLVDGIKNFFSGLWDGIKSIWGAVAGWFKSKIIDPISNFFKGMGDTISNIWNGIINGIKGAINGIIGFINGMVRGITNGINAVIGLLNKLSFNIPEWVPLLGGKRFGFNIPLLNAPQIPLLASGGTLNYGSAIVGEKGPELLSIVNGGRAQVTPLSGGQANSAMQAAGLSAPDGYNVTIANFNNYDTETDIPKLTRQIMIEGQRQIIAHGRAFG